MPTWAKVLLGIGCGLVLVTLAIGVAGFLFVNRHKDQWIADAKKANDDGVAFGQGKTTNDCIDESLTRLRATNGILAETSVRIFLRGCLKVAESSPQMCDAVPAKGEIFKSATWALHECARRGMAHSHPCERLIQELQERCDKK